jgi:hypothetical protein
MVLPTLTDIETASWLCLSIPEFREALPRLGLPAIHIEGRLLFLRRTVMESLAAREMDPTVAQAISREENGR